MFITEFDKNIMISNQQKIVDDLKTLKCYADLYNVDNRFIVSSDLARAERKLSELKGL